MAQTQIEKERTATQSGKVIYTAKTHTTTGAGTEVTSTSARAHCFPRPYTPIAALMR
jgi:hypothetical protein